MKLKLSLNLLLIVAAGLLLAVGPITRLFTNDGVDPDADDRELVAEGNVHVMEATYLPYNDIADLLVHSSLVVTGGVTRLQPSYRAVFQDVPLDQLPAHKAQELGYLLTDVEVTIDAVLFGTAAVAGQTIVVSHMGGELNGQRYVMKDEPLSQPNRSYLFFLEPTDDGKYSIVGGPQGRYRIQNERVLSLSREARNFPVNQAMSGNPLASVAQSIQQQVALAANDEPVDLPADLPALDQKPGAPPADESLLP